MTSDKEEKSFKTGLEWLKEELKEARRKVKWIEEALELLDKK